MREMDQEPHGSGQVWNGQTGGVSCRHPGRMAGLCSLEDLRMDVWIERGTHFFAVAWDEIARALGGRCEHWEVAWVADAGSPHAFLNGAILERPLREDEAEQLTAQLGAFFGPRDGGPWLLWSGGPTPDLSRFGYVVRGHPMAMIRPPRRATAGSTGAADRRGQKRQHTPRCRAHHH